MRIRARASLSPALVGLAIALLLPGAWAVASLAAPYGPAPASGPLKFPAVGTPWVRTLAVELITNGGFESGFTGWTVVNEVNGSGSWFQGPDAAGPLSGIALAAPAEGANQAFSDQTGPGSHILYQDVAIPPASTATLNLILWMNNSAGAYYSPLTLDYNVYPNQQFRIDVMNPAAALDDVGAGVLLNVYQTNAGDPPVLGYTPVSANLSAFAGQVVRLRFTEVDNQLFYNVGVDAVSIRAEAAVPAANATWGGVKGRYR